MMTLRAQANAYIFERAFNTVWLGKAVMKNPYDLMAYQRLIYALKPDWVVETGTNLGGSAWYFATIMDQIDYGRVATIDIDRYEASWMAHPRIAYLTGSSTSPEILDQLHALILPRHRVLVSLDSDHTAANVAKELEAYAPLVTTGSYIVVEDTNLDGHPVYKGWPEDGGPWKAVMDWLPAHPEFEADSTIEPWITYHPNGWLRKKVKVGNTWI